MFVKRLSDCDEFIANDGCLIREILHGKDDAIDLPYSIAVARVEPGKQTYRHILAQTEVYYILSGQGLMHIGDEAREVGVHEAILIPPGEIQWIENTGKKELLFMAIVNPPWSAEEDERLDT